VPTLGKLEVKIIAFNNIITVSLGTIITKDKFGGEMKQNSYGSILDSGEYGMCVIQISSAYENNDISAVFNIDQPELLVSEIGERKEIRGSMVQFYNQIEWQNCSFLVSIF
jgi:hypothetical protein